MFYPCETLDDCEDVGLGFQLLSWMTQWNVSLQLLWFQPSFFKKKIKHRNHEKIHFCISKIVPENIMNK